MLEEINEQNTENTQEATEVESMSQLSDSELSLPKLEVGQSVVATVTELFEKHVATQIDNCELDCIIPISELTNGHVEKVSDIVSIGDKLDLVVIKVEEKKIVLSKRRFDFDKVCQTLEEKLAQGTSITAKVIEIVKGGIVVDIGIRGFVPASMIGERYVEDLSVYVDQLLELKIIEIDKEKMRVVLSHREIAKELRKKHELDKMATLEKGNILEGTVVRLTNFGAFVDLGEIEGLVHVSEIAHERVATPDAVLTVGQKVKVKIIDMNKDLGRISLSIKETLPTAWDNFSEQLATGKVATGVVKRITNFGAFVEIFPGVEGLVHISQMAHKHIKTPHEVISVGETVQVKILKVDHKEQKLSLSIKELLDAEEAVFDEEFELPKNPSGFSIGELFAEKLKGVTVLKSDDN